MQTKAKSVTFVVFSSLLVSLVSIIHKIVLRILNIIYAATAVTCVTRSSFAWTDPKINDNIITYCSRETGVHKTDEFLVFYQQLI